MAARDTAFLTFGRVGQGPDAGVGKEDVLAGESRPGDQAVRFVYEVIYLLVVSDDSVEVSLVADIGRADKVAAVPWVDEVRTAILSGLDVESLSLRCAGEVVHYDVAALGASHHATLRVAHALQHLVDPRTGDVDRHWRAGLVPAAGELVHALHASHGPALDEQAFHLHIG